MQSNQLIQIKNVNYQSMCLHMLVPKRVEGKINSQFKCINCVTDGLNIELLVKYSSHGLNNGL